MSTETMTRPIAVRISPEVQLALAELSKVMRTSLAEQARAAISSYIMDRLSSNTLDQEIESAKARFSRTLGALHDDDVSSDTVDDRQTVSGGVQLSVRLEQSALTRLTSLALLDDNAVADQLRAAFDRHISEICEDPAIEEGLRALRLLGDMEDATVRSRPHQ